MKAINLSFININSYKLGVTIFSLILLSFFNNSFSIFLLSLFYQVSILFYTFIHKQVSFILYFLLFYFSYSVFVSEYVFPEQYSVGFLEAKTPEIYFSLSIIIFIFSSISFLLIGKRNNNFIAIYKPIENNIIYFGLLFILTIIFIFGVNRTSNSSEYTVRISSFFEYSKLLFIFLFIYSQKDYKKVISFLFIVIFAIQDLILGGRITSFQLVLICFVFLIKSSNFRNLLIVFMFPLMIIFANFISYYRVNGFPSNFENYFSIIVENPLFLLDTANYSYYASATHLYVRESISIYELFKTFFDHLLSLVLGVDTPFSNLTLFSSTISRNYGGGFIFSEYFFWFGYLGVLNFSIIFNLFLKFLNSSSNNIFYSILLISIVTFSPRWLLYGNSALIRTSILMPSFFWVLTRFVKSFNIKNIYE